MKNKRPNNRRMNRGRKGGRGRQSEGFGRRATTSCAVGASISGNQGITFTTEQLLRKYFQDPRLVRINGYRIRINILDISQPFLQYQVLAMMDNIGGPLVCQTQPKTITAQRSIQSVSIARDRSFWIQSTDEVHTVLDIKFLAFATTKLVIEITTFFNIEQDEVTSLSSITQAVPYEVTAYDTMFETVSNASTITKQMSAASVSTPTKRLR
jgi:hypothetical protein